MTPLVSAAFICTILSIGAIVWAVRKLEQRLDRVESVPNSGRSVRAVPTGSDTTTDHFDLAMDLPPSPIAASSHLGSRVDVEL